jgi:hypothetical protein
MGPDRHHLRHFFQQIVQREPGPFQLELRGFDFGEIEDVVDEIQQVVARTANDFTIDRCVADKRYAVGGFARMIGRAMRPNGEPVGGIEITVAEFLPGAAAPKLLPQSYTTGIDGIFQFCPESFRRGTKLLIGAYRNGSLLQDTTVRLDDSLTVVRMTIDARP